MTSLRQHAKFLGQILLTLCIAGGLAAAFLWGGVTLVSEEDSAAILEASTGPYRVVQVIDGDTVVLEVEGVEESVRLIGIDAPEIDWETNESECFAWEARNRLTAILAGGEVRLERDASQGQRDAYGRLLGYLLLPDGTDVGIALLKGGYVREFTFQTSYAKQDAFRAAEAVAREKEHGMHAPGACVGTP